MRVVSRIFLIFSGIFCLFSIIASLLYLAVVWFLAFVNVGFNVVLIVLNETGANPELLNLLLQISMYTDVLKFLMGALGMFGLETGVVDSMLSIYLGIEAAAEIVGAVIASALVVLPLILSLVSAIICFVGAGKKIRKGAHIAAIIFAVLNYLIGGAGWLVIIFMLLGGIFGLIADGKEKRKLEELRRRRRYKALPYYAH